VLKDEAIPERRVRLFEDQPFVYVSMSISMIGHFRKGFLGSNWTDIAEDLSYLGNMGLSISPKDNRNRLRWYGWERRDDLLTIISNEEVGNGIVGN